MENDISSAAYELTVSRQHRDTFGQFFTPPDVAGFLVRWVLGGEATSLFDPAVGTGAFQQASLRERPAVALSGCEKDELVRAFFQETWAGTLTEFMGRDYFQTRVDLQQAIVCNPPYLRFQNFHDRKEVLEALSERYGFRFSGYLNAASAFLLKAVTELQEGGRLAFLMPLEFLSAGYGQRVKQVLMGCSDYLHFVRVTDEKRVFPDVITSVGMVFMQKRSGNVVSQVRFSDIHDPAELSLRLEELSAVERASAGLKPEAKWAAQFSPARELTDKKLVPFTTYGRFKRGIATGANEFFVKTEADCDRLGLPKRVRVPCITKSSQVDRSVFASERLMALRDEGDPVVLLDLEAEDCDAVRAYIKTGEELGYAERYLTKQRKPWYKLETRTPPDLLFGVFSRGNFKVVRNSAAAVSLTPFHGFYPNELGRAFKEHIWLFLSSKAGRAVLEREKRTYGGKLDKFEPNDLNKVNLPGPVEFEVVPSVLIESGKLALESGQALPQELENVFMSLV